MLHLVLLYGTNMGAIMWCQPRSLSSKPSLALWVALTFLLWRMGFLVYSNAPDISALSQLLHEFVLSLSFSIFSYLWFPVFHKFHLHSVIRTSLWSCWCSSTSYDQTKTAFNLLFWLNILLWKYFFLKISLKFSFTSLFEWNLFYF